MNCAREELRNACNVFADGDWIESKDQSAEGIRLIQTGNIGFGLFKPRDSKSRFISEDTFKRLRCTEIKEGDILISRLPDPVGRSCIIPALDKKSITAVDCTIVRTKPNLLIPNFLNYYCQSPEYFKQVKKNITGATRQRISRSLLGKVIIPLPPIPTQQNIVSKLDAIFTEVEKSIAAVELNIKNAEILFGNYLKNAFAHPKDGWVTETIGDICTLRSGTTVSPKLEKTQGNLPYLKVADMNLEANKEAIFTSSRFLNADDINKNSIILKGSTIFPKRGGAIDTNKKRFVAVDIAVDLNVMSVLPKPSLNSRLLFLYFLGINMKELGSGASIRQINNYDIAPLLINFPKSLDAQEKLAEKLTNLKLETEKLTALYLKKKLALIAFKQAILKQAFSGELVKD